MEISTGSENEMNSRVGGDDIGHGTDRGREAGVLKGFLHLPRSKFACTRTKGRSQYTSTGESVLEKEQLDTLAEA